eukprot:CAMPEP_0113621150 /NCGR_PEP_ID=MMETSP0017_2-20120614/10800_1 /TAXON_ID=2856 /ORGANISM="Cylindrotheca closterium" /LENGTH=631 /DNA_ID=CAMNT_0000530873 /DNA_START=174 /DNA_END=2069 /DNA_ORIENTATION=+ /assembly_acc=CAM_ASM_000147
MSVVLEEEDVKEYSLGLARLMKQFTPTCQMLQAYLNSIEAETEECSNLVNDLLPGQCGCGSNSTTSLGDLELCQICEGEGDVFRAPERDITAVIEGLGLDIVFPSHNTSKDNITCGELQDTLSNQPERSLICQRRFLSFFRGMCDCPWKDKKGRRSCAETLNCDSAAFTPDRKLDFVVEEFQYPFAPTCQEIAWVMEGFDEEANSCLAASQFAFVCGCGIRPYLGATTTTEQAVLAWVPRVSGLLSAIGSILIIRDVLFRTRTGRSANRNYGSIFNGDLTILQQLVVGMSVFDLCSSGANIVSTLAIPRYQYFDAPGAIPTGVYGAMGNDGTCTAQGFFLQLGYTSALYNLALTVYYFMVIKKGMRESQIRPYRFWFHLPVLLMGIGLAFAAIPYYENIFFVCHVPPAVNLGGWGVNGEEQSITIASSNNLLTIFTVVPIAMVFVLGSANMIMIFLHVQKQDRTADKWRMGNRLANNSAEISESHSGSKFFSGWWKKARVPKERTNQISREVWWQAVFYMGSFLLTWPIYFFANFNVLEKWDNYAFWVACIILFPLQGFWNCLVYFRPQLFRYFRKRNQQQQSQTESEQNSRKSSQSGNGTSNVGATTVSAEENGGGAKLESIKESNDSPN